jgi:hypothetical protein
MIRRKVFAIDISGSTSGSFYYNHVDQIMKNLYQENDFIIFWNHEFKSVSYDESQQFIAEKQGNGGTCPLKIAEAIHQYHLDAHNLILILITDGEVGVSEVDSCDSFIIKHNIRFASSICYIIGRSTSINLSVSCPFSRFCPFSTIQLKDETSYSQVQPAVCVTKEDIELLNNLNQINTFEELTFHYEPILRALTSRVFGTTGDRALRNECVALRVRITKNFVTKESSLPEEFTQALDSNNYQKTFEIGGKIISEYFRPNDFESMIQLLIRMCEGAFRYTFDLNEIHAARATRANTIIQVDALSVEPLEVGEDHPTFKCPISYDNEIDPVIMICTPDQPLLAGLEKKITDCIIDCPLNALKIKTFVDILIQHIDHPVSLNTLREAENAGFDFQKSPITRKPIIGFIPLGPHKSHVNAADWSISKLITGGKALGNKDFWFALIWILVEQNRIPFLTDMLPFLREQMIWRLKNHTSSASLTGLSGYVQTRMRLDAAIYFSLASQKFFPPPDLKYDTLRCHIFHADYLLQLMNLVSINIPEEIKIQIIRIRAMMNLLSKSKKEGYIELLSLGTALVQNGFKVNRDNVHNELLNNPNLRCLYIPLDGPASDSQIQDVLTQLPSAANQLPLNEVYSLIQLVDPQKSAVDIQIPLNWIAPPLPDIQYNWKHYQGKLDSLVHVQICPKTFRPYYILSDNKTWRDAFEKIINPCAGQILSTHSWYMDLCVKLNQIPTLDEMMIFAFGKILNKNVSTLVDYSPVYFKSVMDDFKQLMKKEVNIAIRLFLDSRSIAIREQKEKGKSRKLFEIDSVQELFKQCGILIGICDVDQV